MKGLSNLLVHPLQRIRLHPISLASALGNRKIFELSPETFTFIFFFLVSLFVCCFSFSLFFFEVLLIELRALCVLGKFSIYSLLFFSNFDSTFF